LGVHIHIIAKTNNAYTVNSTEERQLNKLFQKYYSDMMVDSAMTTLDKLIEIYTQKGNLEKETSARWNKIAMLNNSARYDTLLIVADEQMEWFGKHHIWNRYYQAWQRKCSANHDLGRMQTALREARAMGDDAKKRDNSIGRAMAYKQMGIIYFDIRQLDQAAQAFRHSIKLLQQEGENSGIMSGVYDGLCQTLDCGQHYGTELATAHEWLRHLAVVQQVYSLETVAPTYVSCHLAHAAAYIGMKDFDEAVKAINVAKYYYNIAKSTLSQYYIFEMQVRLALAEGKPQTALAYADSIKEMGIIVDNKIKELRADALLETGRDAESAQMFRDLYYHKDSIFTRDMRTQLDELNALFHIDEMQREQQTMRIHFVMITTALILITLILFLFFRWRDSSRLAEKNKELAEKNEALKRAKKSAQESSEMKTEFIKNISHEIRTPLNILNGFTQVLTMKGADISDEEKADVQERIAENTERITKLVNKMLELSDASSHQVIQCNDVVQVNEIVAEATVTTNIANHPEITFSMEISPEVETIRLTTNHQYAVKALTQLLDNSIKFQKQPASVMATGIQSAEQPSKEDKVSLRVSVDTQQGYVVFEVEDTGIGIDPSEAEHIFEEFVQLDSLYDGTGIGLTVARSIARRLGGDITLDTSYTNGARFVMTLPLSN